MGKIIITFLIILFGIFSFFTKETKNLESKVNKSEMNNDSLKLRVKEKDSIINTLNDSLKYKAEKKLESKTKELNSSKLVTATWYQAHGDKTYSGEIFHKDSLTAAYYTKMGTYLKVINKNSGEYVIVKVIDRMGSNSKNKIDLSKKAFGQIANTSSGRVNVIVQLL